MDNDEKKCVVCNKDTLLALFGIAVGLMFIVMSVDILRRMRIEASTVEGEVVEND